MPSQEYGEAFSVLEKCFGDSSFVKAYTALPPKTNRPAPPAEGRWFSASTSASASTTTYNGNNERDDDEYDDNDDDDDDDDDDAASDTSMHEGYGNRQTAGFTLPPNPLGLPPTPPNVSRDRSSDTAHLVPLPPPTDESRLATPVRQTGPPTPDLTPPNTREHRAKHSAASRPELLTYPSSKAESFVTARENASAPSVHNSQLHLRPASPAATTATMWSDTARPMYVNGATNGKVGREGGVEGEGDDEDDDLTPVQELRDPFESHVQENVDERRVDFTPSSEYLDPALMRNVTVRKKRPKPQLSATNMPNTVSQKADSPRSSATTTPCGGQDSSRNSSGTARRVEGADEADWPDAINDMLYRAIRDEKSKRLSGVSTNSTTVEVLVKDTSPRQQKPRNLRRAGRNLAFRDGSPSTRSSLDSSTSAQRQLRRRKSPLPQRKELGAAAVIPLPERRAISTPETSGQQRQKLPVIVIPERRLDMPEALRMRSKMHLLTDQQHRLHHSRPTFALERRAIDDSPTLVDGDVQQDDDVRLRHVSAPLPRRDQQEDSPRKAIVPVIPARPSPGFSPMADWSRQSYSDLALLTTDVEFAPEDFLNYTVETIDMGNGIAQGRVFSSANERQSQRAWHSSQSPQSRPRTAGKLTASGIQQPSFGLSPFLSPHNRPGTAGHSPFHTSDKASTRALFEYNVSPPLSSDVDSRMPTATPLSLSALSDMELGDAQAVNLYPHGNRSLLLVQHTNSRDPNAGLNPVIPFSYSPSVSPISADVRLPRLLRPFDPDFLRIPTASPTLTARSGTSSTEPSTPRGPETMHPGHVESPLTNPRAAPLPPAIKVQPATPRGSDESGQPEGNGSTLSARGKEIRRVRIDAVSPTPGPPRRRSSLVQRARRYSESFVTPFLPRTSSRRSRDFSRPQSSTEREATLHPFWRPRGFWDDFPSDTDTDTDSEPDLVHTPLPAGGDTSDVEPPVAPQRTSSWPRKLSVRMPGFRGTGGFLLGNTLGIDRHGTNVRRHYISLRRKRSADLLSRHRPSRTTPHHTLRRVAYSTESLRQRAARDKALLTQRGQRMPRRISDLGMRVHMPGPFKGVRMKVSLAREEREERKREQRREELRRSIGTRVFHGNGMGTVSGIDHGNR